MKTRSLCLILGLVVVSLAADCAPGGVQSRNGTCFFPSYIEGCFTYATSTSCQDCQYNYAKEGNICAYLPPTDNSNCCKAFIQPSGECSECASGLSLFNGKCIDKKIVGCLVKSKTGTCLNCALSYSLVGGQCIKKTQGCKKYSATGVCQSCESNFNLARGYCIPKEAIIKQETCRSPWLKGPSGNCEIAGCELYYDYGCSKCRSKFRLLPDSSCREGQIEGCDVYAPDGYCKTCKKPVYTQYSGFCIPFGCAKLSPQGKCNQCNSKFGFQISADGYCRIPNCLVSNDKQCLVCEKGFVQTYIGCQRQDPRKICVTCARGFYLTETLDCQPKEAGCISYNRYKCNQCDVGLYLDKDYKCVQKQPGCIYEKGYCASCSFPYKKKNLKCSIEGCTSFSEKGCITCLAPYILSKMNTCTFENCLEVEDGKCLKCEEGFSTSHQGFCYKVDLFCKAYSFSGECIQCKLGYYFEKNTRGVKVCRQQKFGCNYIDGRCVSCRAPFDYNPQEQSCNIDGCLTYFLGGCSKCAAGYDLRYNSCKLPFCLISHKGHCAECDPSYVLKSDGTCVNKDQFCWKYDNDGNCIECSPEYYLSKKTKKCKPRQPGCLYNDNDRCYACEKPFYFDGVRCSIYGCMKTDFKGCDKCFYPMEPTKYGLCNVINCDRMQEDKCMACKPGFMLVGDGSCRQEDQKCQVYGEKGCKKCVKGYKVDRSGICQYGDEHCWTFTQQGYCANCDKLYFLNSLKKCQLKDSNCEAYSGGGRCMKCKSYYYLFKGMCVPNSQGCIVQKNIRQCDQCQAGYQIVKGICELVLKMPSYDDIDMGFFDDETDARKKQSKQVFSVGKSNKKNLIASISKGNAKILYSSVVAGRNSLQLDDTSDVNGWTPLTNNNQFIGVLLQHMQIMYAVDIKYMKGNTLKRFAIQQSNDGVNWARVQQFTIGQTSPDTVETFYFTPVESLAIRIIALQGTPNIKFQFYYGSGNYDSPRSSSTTYIGQQTEETIEQQLNTEQFSVQEGCIDKQLCWMGIELCQAKPIIGFTLESLKDSTGAIQSVSVKYSVDGVKFQCYNDCKEIALVNNSVTLNPRVTGTKLRVYPAKWNGNPKYSVTFEY